MKKCTLIFILILLTKYGASQYGFGTNQPDQRSIVHIVSQDSTKGFIIPIVKTGAIAADPSIKGMLIYNVNDSCVKMCTGSDWHCLIGDNSVGITDDQNIDSLRLNGKILTAYLENGGSASINIQPIIDSAYVDISNNLLNDNTWLSELKDSINTDNQNLSVGSGTASTSIIDIENGDSIVLREGSNIQLTESGSQITISATGDGTGTDDQNVDSLRLTGTTLTTYIENGGNASIDLQPIVDSALANAVNTDNQTIDVLSLTGTTLNISLEDDGVANQTVNLSSLQDGTGTDDQNISGSGLSGTNLTIGIEGGANEVVNLQPIVDSALANTPIGSDDQNLTVEAGTASTSIINIENGDSVILQEGSNIQLTESGNIITISAPAAGSGTDDQNLNVKAGTGTTSVIDIEDGDSVIISTGTGLSISEAGNTITLTNTITDTDDQDLIVQAGTASNSIINITNGDSVVLTEGSNIQLTESGNSITISATGDGTGTDDQNISGSGLSGTNLTIGIENGSNQVVDLQPIVDSALANAVDTDNQTIDVLSLTGTTLNISLEDDGVATQTVNLSSLQDGTGTDDQNLTLGAGTGTTSILDMESGSDVTIQAGSNITLSESGNTLTIAATGDGTGTDDQNISGSGLSGTNLTIGIENGTSQVVDLSPIGGDITAVTAGTGLTGGGTTGAVTINAVGDNGLTTNADDIDLGGALNQNTIITQGAFSMIYNLDGTGDFLVRDAGTNVFAIQDNGQNRFGGNTQWRSGSTTGTILGQFIDDAGDGRLVVYEGGAISIDLDANSASVFNQQGLNRDFRIESLDSNGMLFVDASANRVGIGTESPSAMLDVEGKTQTTTFQMTSGATNNYVLTSDASGNGTWQNVSGLFTDSDNQDLVVQAGTASNSIINITNGDSVVLVEGSNIQLTESGNSITISATGDGTGTDDQNISGSGLSGTNLTIGIENGTSQVVDLSPIGGDITAVTAGTGLTGGGTTGAVTINAVGDNGLTTNADDIDLGGALNQVTTISQGANAMIFDMTGAGDFEVRDNGATALFVRDNGDVGIGISPSYDLHVNGRSHHESLSVDINGNQTMYIVPNDGSGNWNKYWNTLGGTTPVREQAGPTYQEKIQSTSSNSTSGNYQFRYGGYGAAASAITWNTSYAIDYSNGYFGIKNATPAYPLDVTGTAHADAINVNGNYTLPTVDGTSGQVIQTNGSGVLTWTTPSTGTDDQNISGSGLSGTNLTIGIENGSNQVVDLSPIGGDITGVTAGDGLTGGGTTGTVTLNVVATNGLTDAANDVRLGGTLVQNTQINQGAYNMTYNLNGTGDFNLVDGATTRFQVTDAGQTTVGALSGAGTRMVVADAAGVLSTQAIPANGDITAVTAGAGLTGGGTTGAVTVTAAADNGLNVDATADKIQLGGALTENTTISEGGFTMVHNLNGAGDFAVRDNGAAAFFVRDNGNVGLGTESPSYQMHVAESAGGDVSQYASYVDLDGTAAAALTANRTHMGLFIDYDASNIVGTATNGQRHYAYGVRGDVTTNGTTRGYDYRGLYGIATHNSSGDITNMFGSVGIAQTNNAAASSGNVSLLVGAHGSAVVNPNSTGTVSNNWGLYSYTLHNNANTLNNARGTYNYVRNNNGGTISNAYGTHNYVFNNGTGTISNAYGSYAWINQDDAGGTISNSYGHYSYIDHDGGTSTNAYLFGGDFAGTHTNTWGLHLNNEGRNYLSGSLGLGITNPSQKLHVVGGARITNLGGSGTQMVVTDNNGVLSTQAIPANGDITAVTAGDGLTGGGASGSVTLNVVATNGLTDAANDVRLGGTLIQNTQINQGAYNMVYNMNGTGDFNLVDGATTRFQVTDAGQTTVGALSGAGTRMVVANASGVLSTQAIPGGPDNLGNHTATTNLNMNNNNINNVGILSGVATPSYDKLRVWNSSSYTIGMNSAQSYGFLNDYAMTFTMSNTANRGWLWRDASDAATDGAMSLTTDGRLTVKSTVDFDALAGSGTRMVVANAGGVLSTQAIPANGDITGVTAGNGLTGGGASGTVTVNANVGNGLNITSDQIRLGGTLATATTVTQGANAMIYNLNSTGDFEIRDNNATFFYARDDGRVGIGTNAPAYKLHVAGDVYASAGWLRTAGSRGWVNNTHGGGMYMIDATWIRTYGNKSFYHNTGTMRTDGNFQVGNGGQYASLPSGTTATVFNEGSFDKDFRIESDGNANMFFVNAGTNRVGIGTTAPAQALHVNGRIRSNGINETSDRRYKKEIKDLPEDILDKVLQLRGVTYKWKQNEYPKMEFEDGTQIGVIAQEIEEVFPEVVRTDAKGYKSVDYSHLVPVLIEALKRENAKVDGQSKKIKQLEEDNQELKNRIYTIEKALGINK